MRILTTTPYWTPRSFTSEISGIFDEMHRMTNAYDERSFAPGCEVTEHEGHFLLSMDLPGIKKEDVKIDLTENLLTISGERKRESNGDKQQKFQLFERSYGFFKRSFTLPTSVDGNKVEARYENGVLDLYLPKIEAAKPRKIEIQNSKSGFFEKLLGSKNTEEMKDVTNN